MMNPNQAQFGGSFQQPAQQPQQKGCLGRNWKWMLPVGCLGLILVVAAAGGAIFFFAMSAVKSSDVYKGALQRAQSNPAAVSLLGEPIKDGWLVKGNVQFTGGSGSANFEIPLSGPKNSGTLYVRAVNEGGAWMYERLDLFAQSGERVSLLAADSGPSPAGVEGDTNDAANDNDNDESESAPSPPSPPSANASAISGGVLDGKAISKPEPAYPPLAKATHATGTVRVQVTVDEEGNVVSATAVSGHPLLQAAAVAAARQAKLSPTLLSGKPVKVTGILTYNFMPPPE
jgi:TonB family protein